MTWDLLSAEGARAMFAEMRADFANRFRKAGDVPPMVALIITRDERTGKTIEGGAVQLHFIESGIINDHGPYGRKDQLATYVRRAARRSDAVGFLFVSEAWMLDDARFKPSLPSESWEEVPGRREGIIVNAQHKAIGPNTLHWSALITRPKKGKPHLGPWSESAGVVTGRFAGVLTSEAEDSQEAEFWARLIEGGEYLTPEARRDHIENGRLQMVAAGVSEQESRIRIMQFIGMIEERGLKVARLPGDVEPSPARGGGIINLDEEVPVVGAGKA